MIEVTCASCGRVLETDFPGKAVCVCGSRLFWWRDGADKPTRVNYANPNWGARMVEAA